MLSAAEFYKLQKNKNSKKDIDKYQAAIKMVGKVADNLKRLPIERVEKALANQPNPEKKKKKNRKRGKKGANKVEPTASTSIAAITTVTKRKHADDNVNRETKRQKITETETSDTPDLLEGDGEIEVESLGSATSSEDGQEDSSDAEISDDASEEGTDAIDPLGHGGSLLELMLAPMDMDEFVANFYGLKPVHLKGGLTRQNFNSIMSLSEIDSWLFEECMMFGKDVEIIRSPDAIDKKVPLPRGRAFRPVVWNQFALGNSLRFLCPERFSERLGGSLGLLQELLGGPITSHLVFANATFASESLLPKEQRGADGDDDDLYIVQIEGTSEVTIKKPLFVKEKVPKMVVMVAGDVLYLPRRFGHSVRTSPETETSIQLCIVHGAPRIIDHAMTKAFNLDKSIEPSPFRTIIAAQLTSKLLGDTEDEVTEAPNMFPKLSPDTVKSALKVLLDQKKETGHKKVQSVVDDMGIEIIRKTPPPTLHPTETDCHITKQGEMWLDPNQFYGQEDDDEGGDCEDEEEQCLPEIPPDEPQKSGRVVGAVELEPDTPIRLVRRSAVHLVPVGDNKHHSIKIYHCLYNSRDLRQISEEAEFLEVPAKHADAVRMLVEIYPAAIEINDLPGNSLDEKVILANNLYDTGLIVTAEPLPSCAWNDSSDDDDVDDSEEEVALSEAVE